MLVLLTCQADLLAAHEASVLLGFGGFGCLGLFPVSCARRCGGRRRLSDDWNDTQELASYKHPEHNYMPNSHNTFYFINILFY